jgi:CubicO group peptidase (beta-lactamase class C family)
MYRMLTIVLIFCFGNLAVAQTTFSDQALSNASVFSANTGGTAVLIMQNGNIVFEEYHNGADANTATHLHSATKGFWSLLAAHALETGLIESYEERVSQTITEWQDTSIHPYKRLIRIRHLLSLSSGLSQDVNYIQGSDPEADNIYQYVIDSLHLNTVPGNVFQYGPSHYYAFGVLLQRKLLNAGIDQNPLEYLDSILLEPIGLEYDSWIHDNAGNPHLPNGCYITPRNWIKFGQLILQKGIWNDSGIVDSNLVNDLFLADGPNPGHGKFLWLNNVNGHGAYTFMSAPPGSTGGFMYHDGYPEIIGLLGAGKNRMYIIPSLNAVVLRQTLLENDEFDDHTFLSYLLDFTSSSIIQFKKEQVLFFPNPANNIIYLSGNIKDRFTRLECKNLNGRKIFSRQLDMLDGANTIDISSLAEGMYIIHLSGKNELVTLPFVKIN